MSGEDFDFEQPDSEETPGEGSGSGAEGDGRGEGGGKAGDGKDGKSGKGKDAGEVKLSKKDHDALMKRIGELEESERYWADKAKADPGGKSGKGKAAAEDDAEDDGEIEDIDPAKLIDELGTKGIKALQERGLLTKGQALKLIREQAEKIAGEVVGRAQKNMQIDADLTRKFPDLADPKSDLFRRTAQVMKEEYGDDKDLLRNPKLLASAARTAAAELKAESGGRRGEDAGEDERLDRVRRQQGDRGRRGSGFDADEDSGELSSIQKEFAKRMGVSEDAYRKHAAAEGGRRRR